MTPFLTNRYYPLSGMIVSESRAEPVLTQLVQQRDELQQRGEPQRYEPQAKDQKKVRQWWIPRYCDEIFSKKIFFWLKLSHNPQTGYI